ncbi:MAG: MFS transporter [Rhodospirillales bacterium]|nr:MFS transporter [Rhodospirillales bacterium]
MNPSAPPAAIGRPILFLAVAAFAAMAAMRVSDPLVPQLAEDFQTGVGEAAIVASAFSLAYGLAQLALGPIGDRLGAFRVAATMAVLAGLATILAAFADRLATLGLLRLLGGIASGGIIPLAMVFIGEVVPPDRLQAVLARFMSSSILGFVAGQALGGLIGGWIGWRWLFALLGGVFLLAGALLLAEQWTGRSVPRSPPRPFSLATYPALLRHARVRLVIGCAFVEGFLFFGTYTYAGAFLRHAYDLDYAPIGMILAAYGVGALGFSLTAPSLIARLKQRGLVMLGGIGMAVAFGGMAATPPLWAVVVLVALSGLGFYTMHNTLQTLATQMAPANRGAGMSLFVTGLMVGQAVGVELIGRLVEQGGYALAFLPAAIFLPILGLFLRRRLGRG